MCTKNVLTRKNEEMKVNDNLAKSKVSPRKFKRFKSIPRVLSVCYV